MRPLRIIGTLLLVAGCAAPLPAGSTSATLSPIPSSPTPLASPSPAASPPVATFDLGQLPPIDLATQQLTAVCGPAPNQIAPGSGESTVQCSVGIERALRVIYAISSAPVRRVYLVHPPCRSLPCTEDELNSVTVTTWTSTAAVSVSLDIRVQTVSAPQSGAASAWPSAPAFTSPPVERPAIEGAPSAIAEREPYPYCGRAVMGEPSSKASCFRAAVLLGMPAEFVDNLIGTEGGSSTYLYRYAGEGQISVFRSSDGDWIEQPGAIRIGADQDSWTFHGWGDGVVAR